MELVHGSLPACDSCLMKDHSISFNTPLYQGVLRTPLLPVTASWPNEVARPRVGWGNSVFSNRFHSWVWCSSWLHHIAILPQWVLSPPVTVIYLLWLDQNAIPPTMLIIMFARTMTPGPTTAHTMPMFFILYIPLSIFFDGKTAMWAICEHDGYFLVCCIYIL